MKFGRVFYYFIGFAIALSLTACGNNNEAAGQKEAPAKPAVATEATAQPPASPGAIRGKVLETEDASGYTYVRLDDGSKDGIWAAMPKTDLKVGEEITLKDGAVMDNFASKTLNKTFDKIIFSSGVLGGNETVSGAGATGMLSGGSTGSIVPFANLKVAKAKGADAYTVSELFTRRKDLNGKTIEVKGQVVKVLKNIMGKNWIHIQDGTGDPAKNTHDLVITTQDSAAKGDIVTVKGTVEADKDFGSGYKYNVIVEDSKVTRDASATEEKTPKENSEAKK